MTKTMADVHVVPLHAECQDEIRRLREESRRWKGHHDNVAKLKRAKDERYDKLWEEHKACKEESKRRFGDLHDAGVEIVKLRKVVDAVRAKPSAALSSLEREALRDLDEGEK